MKIWWFLFFSGSACPDTWQFSARCDGHGGDILRRLCWRLCFRGGDILRRLCWRLCFREGDILWRLWWRLCWPMLSSSRWNTHGDFFIPSTQSGRVWYRTYVLFSTHAMFWIRSFSLYVFWCGYGSADPHLLLMDPDPAPDPVPAPDPTPFFGDFKDAKQFNCFHIFFLWLTRRHIIFSLKNLIFACKFCIKMLMRISWSNFPTFLLILSLERGSHVP